jgi:hypothetical protein
VFASVALRVWQLRQGLPDFAEEAMPFRKALEMGGWDTGRLDLNPHFFNYPTLSLYLHLLVQKLVYLAGLALGAFHGPGDYFIGYLTDPTPMVLAARLVGVACHALVVIACLRIGERLRPGAGWLAGAMVALAPGLIVTSRAIFADSVMAACALWAVERMMAWRAGGGRARLAAAAVLVGLAAGAKYPGAALVIPLGAAILQRLGRRAPRALAISLAIAFGAFLLTSPYVVLDFARFRQDLAFEGLHASTGHFGNLGSGVLGFQLTNLVRNLGLPGLVALAISLGVVVARRRGGALVVLWLAFASLAIPLLAARIGAEHYLVAVVPLAAVLIAEGALGLASQAPARVRTASIAAAWAIVLLPVAFGGLAAAARGGHSTQTAARRWCEAHLAPNELLIEEEYGARLMRRTRKLEIMSTRAFATSSPEVQRRFLAGGERHVVLLPLAVSGRAEVTVKRPGRPPVRLEMFPHAVDFNRIVYDPRLFAPADLVLTSGAVRGRFEGDSLRFAAECRLYRMLDRDAAVAARFRPGGRLTGPEIVIYRIGERFRAEAARRGPLDPLWWAEPIPVAYRARATELVLGAGAAGIPESLGTRTRSGAPAPWVGTLSEFYADRLRPFAHEMSVNLAELGRYTPAEIFARSTLELFPADEEACLVAATCAQADGAWTRARSTLERTLAALDGGEEHPVLRLKLAKVLARTGEPERARRELERLVADPASGASTARDAREALKALEMGPRARP